MGAYKLLLVPVDELDPSWPVPLEALVMVGGGASPLRVGPFAVIADVGEDKHLTMSRELYDQIEVIG